MRRWRRGFGGFVGLAVGTALLSAGSASAQYTNFEGHQVHPIELTCGGAKLLAVNTPDARLAIFDVDGAGALSLAAEVPVGVEPVSVRARSCSEAWVVNHVSDTLSIVDLTPGSERVAQTINTDDEPSDVIFAGAGDNRAFVSISQRNRVDVYSAATPTSTPLFTIDIDGEDPRALARNDTGTEVYAAVFHSGNQTLLIGGESPPPPGPDPSRVGNPVGPYAGALTPLPPGYAADYGTTVPFVGRPQTSLIVKWRDCVMSAASEWCDDNDQSWNSLLNFSGSTPIQMLDRDVAVIDADATDPSSPAPTYVASVGTLNFGIAVNPVDDKLYVSNTDARNDVRFEMPLEDLGDGDGNEDGVCDDGENCLPALNGHLVDTRITVAQASGSVDSTIDLNPHIDYSLAISSIDESLSLGQPNGMAFNSTATKLYVAAILSSKVAVIDPGTGTIDARIDVGEGPTGVALAEAKDRLYVLNRHDNTISLIDTTSETEVLPRVSLYNPEPTHIRNGRKFLYDGQVSSGRGDVACATCHPFGNMDLLAWDLGDPTNTTPTVRPGQTIDPDVGAPPECGPNPAAAGCTTAFDPLKGPRTTQTLRDLGGTEPLHWHGDRPVFQSFNAAFVGLLRNASQLSPSDMNLFAQFALDLVFPPNPNRNLDDTVTSAAATGESEFLTGNRDDPFECNDCHKLPTGTNGHFINRFADLTRQELKVPHLRNMYEKTGLDLSPDQTAAVPQFTRNGFGFVHDGEMDSLDTFFSLPAFTFGTGPSAARDSMVAFMMQFPTGQDAAVGHQITFDGSSGSTSELNTLLASLDAGNLDLIVTGVFGGIPRSFYCTATSATEASCQPDRNGEAAIDATLLQGMAASGAELTFTAVPVDFGLRMGNDRDEDGFFNQTEIDAGSDPADPESTPGAPQVPALGAAELTLLALALLGVAGLPLRRSRA